MPEKCHDPNNTEVDLKGNVMKAPNLRFWQWN